jgi:hypothetical protein
MSVADNDAGTKDGEAGKTDVAHRVSFIPITRTLRIRLRAVLPTAASRQNWEIPASWQPRAKAPTAPSSSRRNSSSLQHLDPEPTPTELTALAGPGLKLHGQGWQCV